MGARKPLARRGRGRAAIFSTLLHCRAIRCKKVRIALSRTREATVDSFLTLLDPTVAVR